MTCLYRTYRKLLLLYIIVAFGMLGVTSCSQIAFWKPATNEEVAQAEEYLARTIDTLLTLDPAADPEQYFATRSSFEEALQQYLLVTGKADRTIVHFDYEGTNIIIPVHRLEHYDDHIQLMQTATARTLWQRIGPVFQGEIVDIAAIQIGDNKVKLAALFTDSLVVFPPDIRDDDPLRVRIPSRHIKDIRSQIPAGIMETDGSKIYFTTVHSDTSFNYNVQEKDSSLFEHEYPVYIRPVEGRPYFEYYHGEETKNIFSIKRYGEDNRTILLDDRGMLHIYSEEEGTIIYTTDRPWGNRLFKIDREKFAITHPDDNSFILFEAGGDTVFVKGASPQFHGTVSAVTHTALSGTEGYVVSVTTGNKFTGRYSQLHFIPDGMMQWRDADKVPHPLLPDYDARFILVDNLGDIFDKTNMHSDPHPLVYHNIYETLLIRDANGDLINNLASSVQPDMSEKQWTIALKPGVRFSDGTLLDAGRVKDLWNRNIKECKENICVMQWVSKNIDEIEVVDSLKLSIHLDTPLPNFRAHLTAACFQITKETDDHEWAIGTGSYMITDMVRGRITTRRNPYYHRGAAFLEEFTIITRPTDVIEYVTQSDDVGAFVRQPRYIDFFGAIDALQELKAKVKKVYFLALNPDSPRLATANARSRIFNTFERQAVLTAVTEARSEIATSFFTGTNISMEQPESGSTDQTSNSLRILYLAQDPVAEQIAQRLSIRLRQENIQAHPPEGLSRERFQQARFNTQYDILIDSYLPFFSSSAYNLYDLLNRGYIYDDVLAEKANVLVTQTGDTEIAAIEEYIAGQYYLYPLIRTSFHTIIPHTLYEVVYTGSSLLNVSGAWFPQ